MRGRSLVLLFPLLLGGCPRPRSFRVQPYDGAETRGDVLRGSLRNGFARWMCEGPSPFKTPWGEQTLVSEGRFAVPLDCRVEVGAPGFAARTLRVGDLCARADSSTCDEFSVAVPLTHIPSPAALASGGSVSLDEPARGAHTARSTVLSVRLTAGGKTFIDGDEASDDQAALARIRTARQEDPEIRAVIAADATVPHARVIHALDLLKQEGVAKIAFAVSPAAP